MQVYPIKPTLKPPGTKRFKLKYDEVLSNFAFNFNLRRYSKGQKVMILGGDGYCGWATALHLSNRGYEARPRPWCKP